MRERARRTMRVGACLLASAALLPAGALAEVTGAPQIVDGQTLQIAGSRFRLHGIVAPALDQVCHRVGKPYPCGRVARAVLWDLVAGRDVTCTPVPAAGAGANAPPATCTAGGVSLNEGMVETGWALADGAGDSTYGALEDAARAAGRGLWRGAFELPGAPRAAPK